MHRVWQVVYDGEPSMSGQPHLTTCSSEYTDFGTAVDALQIIKRNSKYSSKPNLRLRTRLVGDWEDYG